MVLEKNDPGQSSRMGDKSCKALVQIQQKRVRNVERILNEDSIGGKNYLENDDESHGLDIRNEANCGTEDMKYASALRSTAWSKSTKHDTNNHTRWKHRWSGTIEVMRRTRWLRNGRERENEVTEEKKEKGARMQRTTKTSSLLQAQKLEIFPKSKKTRNWSRQIHQLPLAQKVLRHKCVETAVLPKIGSMETTRRNNVH